MKWDKGPLFILFSLLAYDIGPMCLTFLEESKYIGFNFFDSDFKQKSTIFGVFKFCLSQFDRHLWPKQPNTHIPTLKSKSLKFKI